MRTVKFFLFGKFYIEVDEHQIQKVESRKAEELLVYLLVHRDQPQSREHLADVLWGQIAPEQSKSYLRKALWQLQSKLEPYCGQHMLLVNGEWLQVNPDYEFWLDIDVVEKAFKNTQGVRGNDLDEKQATDIQQAINTYQGDLLDGWYYDWCLYERERLQYLYLALLDKLMDYFATHEEYENGVMFGERILQYDPARERTHRRLMRLRFLAGDRTAALRQYQKCVAALKSELDVEPAERTRLLYEKIRTDKFGSSVQPNQVPKNNGQKKEETLNMLFNRLGNLHKGLNQLQVQIAQDMELIQKTIKNNSS
jgi:DNA-binding SARP family transcriptional activator